MTTQTIKRLPARAEKGRSVSKDGRYWMWRDSLYSNSGGYDPMKAPAMGGTGVVVIGKREERMGA